MPLESISLFPNPNVPDLGCFVKRVHELETDSFNIYVEFSQSSIFDPTYHQLYFRVVCGDAALFQRCLVYQTTTLDLPLPPDVDAIHAQFVLGGEYTPHPSEWQRYNPSLHYQNRLRHRDYLNIISQTGFEILEDNPMLPSEKELDSLRNMEIDAYFLSKYTVEELAIKGTKIVLKK